MLSGFCAAAWQPAKLAGNSRQRACTMQLSYLVLRLRSLRGLFLPLFVQGGGEPPPIHPASSRLQVRPVRAGPATVAHSALSIV